MMVALLPLGVCTSAFAATPSSGSLTDTNPKVTYTGGPYAIPNVTDQLNGNGFPTCDATNPAEQCDMFTLNVNVAAGDASTKQIRITISWSPVSAADYDLFVYKGPYQNSSNNVMASNPSGVDPAVVVIPAVSGTYTITLDPFAPLGDTFVGTVTLETIPTNPPPATGPTPRYQVYPAPPSAGGAATSGEPSIGVDWNPNVFRLKFGTVNAGGVLFFTSNFHEYRVDMDDCSSPANSTWTDVTTLTETDPASLDPIGFCDHFGSQPSPGRVFQSQLAGPAGSVMADSDNDGDTWTQSQGGGQPAGVDHQTVGAGPYNPNAIPPPPPHPLYPNAVYYCSQDLVTAFCARSDDGGVTFGAGVAVYNLTQCGGIHGHVKVAPDGTVYVPNKGCGANQAVAVSTDNGLTWSVRPIPDSTPASGIVDPSVGIASDGTVYFGYQDGSGHPKIAISHDRGLTWSRSVDVGVSFGIQNSTFPEVAAGDSNRASFMFLGTPTGGNYQDPANFTGIWHLYIATTLDGGKSYATVDATPTDPVQVGSICNLGTTGCSNNAVGGADRNMLDFMDLSIDSEGRAAGAFADGCVAGSCDASSSPNASRSALGTVVRQSGGPRLFSAFDPVEPALPGAPQLVSALQMTGGTLLSWLAPDNGGSSITEYRIYRGDVCCEGNNEVFLKKIKPTKTAFFDTSKAAQNGEPYFYYVTAVNSMGEGPHCGQVESVPGPPVASPCILPGLTVVTHGVGSQTGAPANSQLNINSISIAEPFVSATAPNQLTITMKVQELSSTPTPQPNSQWNVLFTAPNGTEYFVDMNTEGTTAAPAFTYGHIASLPTGGKHFVTDGTADSGRWAPDGTIQIVIADSKVGGLAPGSQLVNINGTTQTEAGTSVTGGLLLTIDSTGAGKYVVVGNQSCSGK
ncbi:MAG: hypothetical protein DMG21_21545 [Acidobacteria bacterium]|nr:MAG: hypothetical protein DMG21_21545 [Acidobacteriota bacterium]